MKPKTATCLTFAITPDAASPKRFSGIAYSGGLIPQYGWHGDAAIDLSTMQIPEGRIFALVDHDPSRRAGHLTASIKDGALHVEGELFDATESGREVSALLAAGAPWQMSVGIQAETESGDKKRAVKINNRKLEINTLFKHAALREVSFVPVGADPNTSVASFSRNLGSQQKETHKMEEIDELKQQVAALTASLEAEKTARATAETSLAEITLSARKSAVTALLTSVGMEDTTDNAAPYLDMPAATFAAVSQQMQALKPASQAPSHLFSEQAKDGKGEEGSDKISASLAKMTAQLQGA